MGGWTRLYLVAAVAITSLVFFSSFESNQTGYESINIPDDIWALDGDARTDAIWEYIYDISPTIPETCIKTTINATAYDYSKSWGVKCERPSPLPLSMATDAAFLTALGFAAFYLLVAWIAAGFRQNRKNT